LHAGIKLLIDEIKKGGEHPPPSCPRGDGGLEIESGLQFDGSATECILGLSEMRIQDICLDVRKIDFVEEVVEICANLKFGPFAENPHARKAEGLAESRVDVEIGRATEGIAGNPRRLRDRTEVLLTSGASNGIRTWEQALVERASDNAGCREKCTTSAG